MTGSNSHNETRSSRGAHRVATWREEHPRQLSRSGELRRSSGEQGKAARSGRSARARAGRAGALPLTVAPALQDSCGTRILLVMLAVVGLDAWRLQVKHRRQETLSYDGDERFVTKADVWVSRVFLALVATLYLYSVWLEP
jgi:hypothetical protein